MSKQQASNYYLFYIAADISYTVPAIMITVTDLGPSVRKKYFPTQMCLVSQCKSEVPPEQGKTKFTYAWPCFM